MAAVGSVATTTAGIATTGPTTGEVAAAASLRDGLPRGVTGQLINGAARVGRATAIRRRAPPTKDRLAIISRGLRALAVEVAAVAVAAAAAPPGLLPRGHPGSRGRLGLGGGLSTEMNQGNQNCTNSLRSPLY